MCRLHIDHHFHGPVAVLGIARGHVRRYASSVGNGPVLEVGLAGQIGGLLRHSYAVARDLVGT
jgi:hypothetical protein